MKLLLDTCVLSGLRHPHHINLLKESLNAFESGDLFISVISIGEITKGITLLPHSKKRSDLQNWALHIENSYTDRLLTITIQIVHVWGEITANAQKKGKIIPVADGLIAATALVNGLHLMTRNAADFEPTGVLILNPWD